jgi:hypothetical protein
MESTEKLSNQVCLSLNDSDLQQLARLRSLLGFPGDYSNAALCRYLVRDGLARRVRAKMKAKKGQK